MMMKLDEIRALVSIAQLGGVTRAAGTLNRSQPAVSRRIRQLEEALGARIIEKVSGGVILTEAGRAFLPYAEAALATIEDGIAAVRDRSGKTRGSVAIALVGTLAGTSVIEHVRRFARDHENVDLVLRTANSREVSDLVRRGEVTLGLRYFDDDSPELVSRVVAQEALVVVAAPSHRLAGRREVKARDLREDRWIGFPRRGDATAAFAALLERQLIAAGLDNAEIAAIDSLTAQKRVVEIGFGLALLPESSIQEELRLGTLAVLDVKRLRASTPVAVVHRRNGYLSGAAKALLALVSAVPITLRRPAAATPTRRERKSTRIRR
jgi:DNA-binding transcriptional LysR family regulator